MGDRALTKIYYGLEASSSQGTAVAADTQLLLTHPPFSVDRTNELIEEDLGVRARGVRNRVGDVIGVSDVLNFEHAYFQMLPVLFSCGIKGSVTPAEQTSGSGDYLWDFTPSYTATNNIDSITMEFGDNTDAYEREYCMFEGYRIQGEIPQSMGSAPVTIEGQYFARQNTKASFTGAINIPTTTNINAKLVQFYRDTSWAGVGGTEVTGMLRRFDIQIMTGVHPKWHGDANRYFNIHGEGKLHFIANFTFEGNSSADDIYDLMNTGALSVVRLFVDGPQIGSGNNHNLTLDLGGFWRDVIPLAEEVNGNNLHTAVLEGEYDITGAKVLDLAVTTNVSAI